MCILSYKNVLLGAVIAKGQKSLRIGGDFNSQSAYRIEVPRPHASWGTCHVPSIQRLMISSFDPLR
jgi:hypothetical protein